jgi:hypothetical protein
VGAVFDGPGWECLPHGGQQEVLVIAREQAVAVFVVFILWQAAKNRFSIAVPQPVNSSSMPSRLIQASSAMAASA